MSGYLKLANGACVAIEAGFVLGRVAGCNLVIDDGKASRRHAKFHVEAGVVEIEDLQSSNGTLLNEKPVTRRMLRDGDRIQIGKTVLVFHEGQVPGSAAAASRPTTNLDDNDLFGDGPTMVGKVVPLPAPAPSPVPPPPVARPVAAASLTPPLPPKAPPAPVSNVVEFEDEVVEVRKASPPANSAAAASKPSASTTMASGARILQYQKKSGGGGLLGDDLAQVGGGKRALLVLAVLALGAGIVYGIVVLTS